MRLFGSDIDGGLIQHWMTNFGVWKISILNRFVKIISREAARFWREPGPMFAHPSADLHAT